MFKTRKQVELLSKELTKTKGEIEDLKDQLWLMENKHGAFEKKSEYHFGYYLVYKPSRCEEIVISAFEWGTVCNYKIKKLKSTYIVLESINPAKSKQVKTYIIQGDTATEIDYPLELKDFDKEGEVN